ncbi:MAG: histidinol-phosphatase HisJ family protein [Clostridiales bacterium]|jgi:histidinol-phosphatase (PHP family)|nr:histidinol-phosphatase HisJ family protein [Clostridiales bacterium]
MLYDTHVHSKMSADSDMEPREAMNAAKARRLGVILTEHLDYECDSDLDFAVDLPRYLREYEPYKAEGLLTGLEIGLTDASASQNREAAASPGVDYIIGSIHMVDGHDIYTTFFARKLPPDEIYRQYLQCAARMAESCDFFDSLGHIDYPSRYSPFPEKEIPFSAYPKEYNQIFEALLSKGKVLELNTRRLASASAQKNWLEVLRGYYERGGRYITIGSDAHEPGQVGRHFDAALRMARSAGLTPVYFQERRMHNIDASG